MKRQEQDKEGITIRPRNGEQEISKREDYRNSGIEQM